MMTVENVPGELIDQAKKDRHKPRSIVHIPQELGDLLDDLAAAKLTNRTAEAVRLIREGLEREGLRMVVSVQPLVQPEATFRCTRCNHGWASRKKDGALPKQCPACGSPYWNKPRLKPKP